MDGLERVESREGWRLGHGGRTDLAVPERSDAARNRRRVLAAARALFGEKGVTRVTMEEIARAAGVGKGTLYRRFPHKGLLCEALLDEPTREIQEEAMEIAGDSNSPPLKRLDLFLDRYVGFVDHNLDLLYGGHEPLTGSDRLARFDHPSQDWPRWTVLGLLRAAAREGDLRDLDLDYLATALLAPLNLDLFYHQRRIRGLPTERISAGVRSLVPKG